MIPNFLPNENKLKKYCSSNQIKSFIILAALRRSVYRVFRLHLRFFVPAGDTGLFEEISQRWRVVGNTVSDLTGPRFEPQTSRSRSKRATPQPIGR